LGVTVVGVTMEVPGVLVVTGLRARQVRRVLPAALWEDGGSLVGRAEQALRVSMVEEAVAAVVGEDRRTASPLFVNVTTLVQVGVAAELVARVVLAVRADGAAAAATASSWSITGRVVRSWTVG